MDRRSLLEVERTALDGQLDSLVEKRDLRDLTYNIRHLGAFLFQSKGLKAVTANSRNEFSDGCARHCGRHSEGGRFRAGGKLASRSK